MAASGVAMAPDFTSNAPRFRMDARFRMNEAAALALALAAHVGVVALLVLRPAAPPPAPPQRMEVTLADDVGLQASAPSHAPAAADLAPVLGEVQPEPAKPQPAAQPQHEAARSVMVPMPAPIPHHVTKPAPPEKPAKSKPEPKPAPAKAKPAPPKPHSHDTVDPVAAALAGSSASAHKTQKPAGGSRSGQDFLKGVTSADSTGKAAATAPAAITGPQRAALGAAILRQLKPHWTAPQGADAEQLVTVLEFYLNPDGTLAGEPRVVSQSGIDDSNRPQAARHAEQAKRAVHLAAPFQLPPELYTAWKHITNAKFNRNLSQ